MIKNIYQLGVIITTVSIFFPYIAFAYQPNDPQFNEQIYLKQINATEAWDLQKRADDIVVAVIDTGVDLNNPELINASWINKKEVANNNIDDDKNGYIDDINGWNFIENNSNYAPHFYSNITRIGVSHGTAVAGIIAAEADNNIGITGLAPGAKIMSLRALTSNGDGEFSAVIEAMRYAINNGANIINLSMVSPKTNDEFESVVKEAVSKNILVVTATGNQTESSYKNDTSIDLNLEQRYPICSNNGLGVLGVGSVNQFDVKSPFSNYGSNCLDVSAPGEGFISTTPFNPLLESYRSFTGGTFTGTSVSAPLVSATAALIWQKNRNLTAKEIESIIITSGDDIEMFNPLFLGQLGVRLNVYKALLATNNVSLLEKYVGGSMAGSEPYIYVFSKTGELENKFLAYDKRFRGGFRFAVGDVNGDNQAEIITIAGNGGGPHLRIFNSGGLLISQFMVGSDNQTSGHALTLIDAGNGQKNIAVVNQNTKQPLLSVYNWQGKLINSFSLKKENGVVNTQILAIKIDTEKDIGIATINTVTRNVKIHNQQGNVIIEWALPFDYKDIVDFFSLTDDKFVVVKKDKAYVFDYFGKINNVFDSGYLYQIDKEVVSVNRYNDKFFKNSLTKKDVFLVKDVVKNITNLRLLAN